MAEPSLRKNQAHRRKGDRAAVVMVGHIVIIELPVILTNDFVLPLLLQNIFQLFPFAMIYSVYNMHSLGCDIDRMRSPDAFFLVLATEMTVCLVASGNWSVSRAQ